MSGHYCQRCGATHGIADQFCERCGAPLIEQASALAGVGTAAQASGYGPGPTAPPGPAYRPGAATPTGPVQPSGPAYPSGSAYVPGSATPPPRPGRTPTTTWIGVAAGVVALLIIASLAVVFQTRDDQEPVALTAPSTDTEADATDRPSPTPTPSADATQDEGKPETVRAPVAEGSSVDVSAAGIDFAWLDLPDVAPYPALEWVADDTGAITVQVPTAWADRDMGQNQVDGVAVPSIWVAPDIEAFVDRWSGPGVMVELLTGPAATGSVEAVLEDMSVDVATADACDATAEYAYDDGWYTGSALLHSGCGGSGSALLQIVAAEGVGRMLTVQVQMTSTADIDAAVQVINTFQAITAPAPAPAQAPAPAPAPAPAAPTSVYDLPGGLMCRDVEAYGFDYAEAVDYWSAEGMPDRLDADLDGIPCETVYPASEVEAFWGYTPDPAPDDESAEVLEFVHQMLYSCGYSPTLDSYVDGPYADGGYTASVNADVGYDIIYAQFEVFPWSWQITGFDAAAEDLLSCSY